MDLGDKIKAARTQKGITQKELAEKTGLTERTIQRLENNHSNPSPYSLEKIEKVLNISLSQISVHSNEENDQIKPTFTNNDIRVLFIDLKLWLIRHKNQILLIVLLILFLLNYKAIKSGLIDGWFNH